MLYKSDMIKEKLSEILRIPKDKLEVKRTTTPKWGPDFYVYCEGKLVAIVEVETTTNGHYIVPRLGIAKKQLTDYFTKEEWKESFSKAKYGISIVVLLEDLDKAIVSNFSEGIKPILSDDMVINPNYEG